MKYQPLSQLIFAAVRVELLVTFLRALAMEVVASASRIAGRRMFTVGPDKGKGKGKCVPGLN
jgi:hypothetical protein